MLLPQLQDLGSVPDPYDPLFSVWRIGWVFRQLTGDPRSLWDANIFHPAPQTFANSDAMLLPALSAAPLLAAGVHPVVSYNLLLIGSFFLSAVAAYLLGRELTGSRPAAFVAGVIFGFYPFRFEHYSHLELQMSFWMPLCLLALHRFAATRRLLWAIAAGALAVAQFYSSMYLGTFFAMYAVIVAAVLGWKHRADLRELAPRALAVAIIAAVCALPLARAYASNADVSRGRPPEEIRHFSAERIDYLRSQAGSTLWAERTPSGRQAERQLFPGAVAPVLAGVGLVGAFGAVPLAYGAALAFAYEASHGPNGLLFEPLAAAISPLRSIRVPARYSMLVGLSLAILACFGVRRLLRGRSKRAEAFILAAITAATLVDLHSQIRLQRVWPEPPAIYAALPPDAVLVELPARGEHNQYSSIPYQYFSVWHGRALINGYSGYAPAGYAEFERTLMDLPQPEVFDELRARGTTHLTVNCALFRFAGYAGRCSRFLDSIRRSPDVEEMVHAQWEGDEVALFRLR